MVSLKPNPKKTNHKPFRDYHRGASLLNTIHIKEIPVTDHVYSPDRWHTYTPCYPRLVSIHVIHPVGSFYIVCFVFLFSCIKFLIFVFCVFITEAHNSSSTVRNSRNIAMRFTEFVKVICNGLPKRPMP